MPDSYGKRQRSQVKAKKANAREERRLARNRRRSERRDGVPEGHHGDGAPVDGIDDRGADVAAPDTDVEGAPSDEVRDHAAEPARSGVRSQPKTGPEQNQ